MKAKSLLVALLVLFAAHGCALTKASVRIAKNETDKFNGTKVVETRAEQLCFKNTNLNTQFHTIYLCLRKVNDSYVMPVSIALPEIEKYVDNSGVTFLLKNGQTVVLNTSYTGLGAERDPLGGDSHYFSTVLHLSDSDVNLLSTFGVTDVRIRYLGGVCDMSVHENRQDLIIQMFKAIEQAQD